MFSGVLEVVTTHHRNDLERLSLRDGKETYFVYLVDWYATLTYGVPLVTDRIWCYTPRLGEGIATYVYPRAETAAGEAAPFDAERAVLCARWVADAVRDVNSLGFIELVFSTYPLVSCYSGKPATLNLPELASAYTKVMSSIR